MIISSRLQSMKARKIGFKFKNSEISWVLIFQETKS